jgi:hypothetical protein
VLHLVKSTNYNLPCMPFSPLTSSLLGWNVLLSAHSQTSLPHTNQTEATCSVKLTLCLLKAVKTRWYALSSWWRVHSSVVQHGWIKGFVNRRHFSLLGRFGDSRSNVETTVLSIIRANGSLKFFNLRNMFPCAHVSTSVTSHILFALFNVWSDVDFQRHNFLVRARDEHLSGL